MALNLRSWFWNQQTFFLFVSTCVTMFKLSLSLQLEDCHKSCDLHFLLLQPSFLPVSFSLKSSGRDVSSVNMPIIWAFLSHAWWSRNIHKVFNPIVWGLSTNQGKVCHLGMGLIQQKLRLFTFTSRWTLFIYVGKILCVEFMYIVVQTIWIYSNIPSRQIALLCFYILGKTNGYFEIYNKIQWNHINVVPEGHSWAEIFIIYYYFPP